MLLRPNPSLSPVSQEVQRHTGCAEGCRTLSKFVGRVPGGVCLVGKLWKTFVRGGKGTDFIRCADCSGRNDK